MGFSLDTSVPGTMVFLQGLLSFFSPCVLPLIPLYIGYLSGGTGEKGDDGRIYYKGKKVMINTLFFVIGISFAFFALGLGFSALGSFFSENRLLFARIGGAIVFIFGLYQLGIFGGNFAFNKEYKFHFDVSKAVMSPLTALVMGFTFSFAWTPCVGPAMASVLIMAASASTKSTGFILIGVYTLGFVLPFIAVGLFTTRVISFFKSHMNVVKYTARIGGVIMILMGILMFTGKMNAVSGYLSDISYSESEKDIERTIEETTEEATKKQEESSENEETLPAIDFTLYDQYGNTHKLSDYKEKTVFLNFWATWCPPCKAEMPDIQKIYEEYERDGDNALIVLGVASPNIGGEKSEEEIKAFLEENGYTYPVVFDNTGEIFAMYGVSSLPTTFMIDREGNVFGYVSGQLNEEIMRSIIGQTMEGRRE